MKHYDIEFSAINIFFGVIVSFALGDISYRTIENTLRKRVKLQFNIVLFSSTLALCLFVMFTKGVSFRFSDTLKQVVEYRMTTLPRGLIFASSIQIKIIQHSQNVRIK